jgi:hypothetical protein
MTDTATKCQHCSAPASLYLCPDCAKLLDQMLEEIPDREEDLEVTRTCQDRIVGGSVGKSAERPWPIRVGAMNLAAELLDLMTEWTDRISETHGEQFLPAFSMPHGLQGPLLPGWQRLPLGYSGTATQRSKWLRHHLQLLLKDQLVGQFYDRLADLVGDPDKPSRAGRIVLAIDRNTRQFAGLCPTTVRYGQEGKPVECGNTLYSINEQAEVDCSRCGAEGINVERNRARAMTERDLMDERRLLSTLDAIGEHVPRVRLYDWLRDGRLKAAAYMDGGQVVAEKRHHGSVRLFSLSRVRALQSQHDMAKAAS